MRFINIRHAALGLVLMTGVLPARATVVDVHFTFSNPDWSATASYDDTSGQPWAGPWSASISAYALDTLEVTLAGIATWDITELILSSTPPDGGLLEDSTGNLSLFVRAYDAASGLDLSALPFVFAGEIIQPIVVALDASGASVSTSVYTSHVKVTEPVTLALMGLGLAGIGCRRRYSRSRQ